MRKTHPSRSNETSLIKHPRACKQKDQAHQQRCDDEESDLAHWEEELKCKDEALKKKQDEMVKQMEVVVMVF